MTESPPPPNAREESRDRSLLATVRALTASPLLYVGAVTVVAGTEIVGRLPLPEFWQALVLFPLALVLLYAQLAALVLYRRRSGSVGREGQRGC